MRTINSAILTKLQSENIFVHTLLQFTKDGVPYRFTDADVPIVIPDSMVGDDSFILDGGFEDVFASPNIVNNPTFNVNTNGWTGNLCTLASVTGGYSGNCLRLTRSSGDYQYASQAPTMVQGKRYRLTFWVKSGTSGNQAFWGAINQGDGYILGQISGTSSGSWVTYYCEATIPAGETAPYIVLVKNSATAGTMLFDEVTVEEVPLTGKSWSWVTTGGGSSTVNKDSSIRFSGNSSLRFDVDGNYSPAYVYQSVTLLANKNYRISLRHKTSSGNSLANRLFVNVGEHWLQGDGTWTSTRTPITAYQGNGDWCRLTVDFTTFSDHTVYDIWLEGGETAGDANKSVWYDEVRIGQTFPNLVLNSGFESGVSTNWVPATSAGGATVTADNTVRFRGNYSCKCHVSAVGEWAYVGQSITLVPNTQYILSFRWRSLNTNSSIRRIDLRTHDQAYFLKTDGTWNSGSNLMEFPEVAGQWNYASITFTSRPVYTDYDIYPSSDVDEVNDIWFDDVSIRESINTFASPLLYGRYEPRGIKFENVQYSSTDIVDSVKLKLDGIDQSLQPVFIEGDIQEEPAILSLIYLRDDAPTLGALDCYYGVVVIFIGKIDEWMINEDTLSVTISSILSDWSQNTLSIHSPSCRWKVFKGDDCQYSGSESLCDRSYARCTALGNTVNFGGFRWLPSTQEIEIFWGKGQSFKSPSHTSPWGSWE